MTDLNSTGREPPATRRVPLSEIANHLRNRSRLSPVLQKLVEQGQRPEGPDDDFDIQQVAIVLKAAEIAAANHPANFSFAAGYIAGLMLTDSEFARAKAIAATL